jgi:hypothetical protein
LLGIVNAWLESAERGRTGSENVPSDWVMTDKYEDVAGTGCPLVPVLSRTCSNTNTPLAGCEAPFDVLTTTLPVATKVGEGVGKVGPVFKLNADPLLSPT